MRGARVHPAFMAKMLIFCAKEKHMKQGRAGLVSLAIAACALPLAAQEADPPPIIVESEKPQSEKALAELAREIAGNPRDRDRELRHPGDDRVPLGRGDHGDGARPKR